MIRFWIAVTPVRGWKSYGRTFIVAVHSTRTIIIIVLVNNLISKDIYCTGTVTK